MKKIVFLMLMIIMLLTLCGCDTMSKIDDEDKVEGTRFKRIESYAYGSIVVDSETNVEYWMSEGAYNYGTLTMLVDGSGNPKVRK